MRTPALSFALVFASAASLVGALLLQGCGAADTGSGNWDATQDSYADGVPDTLPDAISGDSNDDGYVPADWELACSPCTTDSGCDDGLTCTGQEQCVFSQWAGQNCCHAEPVLCPTEDPCSVGRCSEDVGGCVYNPLDADGDGHPSLDCGYDDCDDGSYPVHPGARELCDGFDNDCDGTVDEDAWAPVGSPMSLSDPGTTLSSLHVVPGTSGWAVTWVAGAASSDSVARAGVVVPGTAGPEASTGDVPLSAGEPSGVAVIEVGAGAGHGFAVVAAVPLAGGATDVVAVPMDSTGTLDGSEASLFTFPASVLDLSVAFVPSLSRLALFFRSDLGGDYEIWFAGIDWSAGGPTIDAAPRQVTTASGFSGKPSAVALDDGFAVAWEDGRDGNTEIYFALLDAEGVLEGPARRLTAAPGDSQDVSLAFTGYGFGLAWMDSRDGGYDMLFTCLDAAGARICPEIGVAPPPGGGSAGAAWFPSLWSDGTPGQLALAYAGLEDGAFTMRLTAVPADGDPAPDSIDPGMTIDHPSASVLGASLSDVAGYRGIAWIESDTAGASTLVFQQLECVED